MGYYTDYSLKIHGIKENLESSSEFFYDTSFEDYSIDLIKKFIDKYELEYALQYNGETENSTKWYDHDENLIEFSKQYPLVVFELKGDGEESGDMWIKYYKNGKSQRCDAKITFEKYDESKLK